MKTGANQSLVRQNNITLVMDLLRFQSMSNTDLAYNMNLSNPALTKILNELMEKNIICEAKAEEFCSNQRGRKKVYYQINDEGCLLGMINFYNTYLSLQIASLSGMILEEKIIDNCEFPTIETLQESVHCFRELLKKYETTDKKLLSIVISSPGKINKQTHQFLKSPKFIHCEQINLVDFYQRQFCVHTSIYNDINLYMIGEREKGKIHGLDDAILIHVDTGIGGAILYHGKIVEGSSGYAGEFGLMKTFDQFGNKIYFDSLCSTNSLKRKIKYSKEVLENNVSIKKHFKLKDVIEKFHEKEPTIREIVLESAKNISLLVENLYNIFDCKNIFISGRVRNFKEDYLQEIKKNLDVQEGKNILLEYTLLGDEAISLGAIRIAQENAIQEMLTRKVRKTNE